MIRALEAHPLVGVTESAGEPVCCGGVCSTGASANPPAVAGDEMGGSLVDAKDDAHGSERAKPGGRGASARRFRAVGFRAAYSPQRVMGETQGFLW